MLHCTKVHDPHTIHVNLELDYLVDKGVPMGHDGPIRASSLPDNEAAKIKGGGNVFNSSQHAATSYFLS